MLYPKTRSRSTYDTDELLNKNYKKFYDFIITGIVLCNTYIKVIA